MKELPLTADELVNKLLALPAAARLSLFDSCGRTLGGSRYLIAGINPLESFEFHCQNKNEAENALQFLDEKLKFYRQNGKSILEGFCAATFGYDLGLLLEDIKPRCKEFDNLIEPSITLAFYKEIFVHDYITGKTFAATNSTDILSLKSFAAEGDAFNSGGLPNPPSGDSTDLFLKGTHLIPLEENATPSALETNLDGDGRLKNLPLSNVSPSATSFRSLQNSMSATENGQDNKNSFPLKANIDLSSNFTREKYLEAVEKIRKHIALGNIYQANLTQQFRVELAKDLTPEMIFARLRKEHPAPFAAFLRRANDAVVSASPERFLQISQTGEVTTSPIKGTRRRGKTAEEDAFLRQQLETSAKDRAENVMIVDLLRNDIGRVCEFNSVKVEKLCEIEEHPTLFHLVSTIKGQLREDANVSDLIKAAFPCGSITGAPKIRAMQILDEIETAPRGLSMGAIGYFAFDGAADLNVAIRTMTIKDSIATFNVGGGIVFDSEPQAEFDESLLKAQALLKAVGAN
jgi:aminodeoxychorismate synthase component I